MEFSLFREGPERGIRRLFKGIRTWERERGVSSVALFLRLGLNWLGLVFATGHLACRALSLRVLLFFLTLFFVHDTRS